jgi:hypothetical protein
VIFALFTLKFNNSILRNLRKIQAFLKGNKIYIEKEACAGILEKQNKRVSKHQKHDFEDIKIKTKKRKRENA